MTDNDIAFLQDIAEQLLLYCADSRIKNRAIKKRAEDARLKFLFLKKQSADESVPLEVSQLNIQNRQPWSIKELKELPFLKDMKYRLTANGYHQFRYRRDGINVSFTSKDFNVAKNKAREFIKDLKAKMKKEHDGAKQNTLDFVALTWLQLKKAHTAPSTFRVYKGVYDNHVAPTFGKRPVDKILPMDLQPFFNDLFSKQEKTCEDAKIVLNGIFKYAVANRLCPTNPMQGVIVEKHFRKTGTALSEEQLQRFKNVMHATENPIGLASLIILYSGIRGAELESMTFDWLAGTFTVNNAKLKKSQRANPANLKRTVPIFPGLWELRHRIESEPWKVKASTLTCKFCNYWKENTVKDLRHTFASKAREAGIDNELVNLWTGHLPGKNVTANVYTHFSLKIQQEQAKRLKPY